jgi:tRNA pseudouridine55 synthase
VSVPAGVFPVDKPEGPTSHDVVAVARKALGERRIGHTGTLDPFASGLLLLCVGRATRLAEFLTGLDKTYEATARLGIATDTEDREGEVIAVKDGWQALSASVVADALASFSGDIEQVPPQFSAKKVDGEAMHRKARRGEYVALPPRLVTIHEIELLELALPDVRFRVRCSSGTYIRSLARDVGEALGVGAHLTHLRRTAVGRFSVEDAVSPDALGEAESAASARIDPLTALGHLPTVEADEAGAADLRHGRRIPAPEGFSSSGDLVAVGHLGDLVAVAEVTDGSVRPKKVFPHD